MTTLTRYGTTALVTGASSGIGKAYAQALAAEGLNLVLVARRKLLLDELAAALKSSHGVEVHTIAQDLSENDAADKVADTVATLGLEIDILINNAGFGSYGLFDELPLDRELEMIQLSCRAPVALTHKFLGGMKQRGRGAVVFLSSVAGTFAVPYMSTYSATKAFPLFFAQSLYGELAGSGVDVLAVAPGDTSTEFRESASFHKSMPSPVRTAEDVAANTFRKLGRTPLIVDGIANKLTALSFHFTPRKLAIWMAGRIWEPMKR